MSDHPDPKGEDHAAPAPDLEPARGVPEGSPEVDDADARAVRALLKRSLARDEENAPDLLAGVQRRIRMRSRGKFFADGWSTHQARASYALIGLATLLLVVLAYLVLSPMDMR
jgi:hypothetical protein